MEQELEEVRQRIRQLDAELVERAAERVRLARRIGDIKRAAGRPVIDFAQERRVLDAVAAAAAERGLAPEVAEDLFARLIRAAVTIQEEESLRHAGTGRGKHAVVLGGAGRMGRWIGRFLEAQGWGTSVVDPAAPPEENRRGDERLTTADLVVAATPPGGTAALYRRWCAAPPAGIVVDISSIKSPLIGPIRALQEAGARVASIHPMFGPAAVLLRGADVVVCDTGDAAAGATVEALFAPTTAHLVHLPLEEHDRVMADLLSLAHATAIAFALALPAAEHPVRSTTFQALERLAATVVRESPDVYYEIQAENPHSAAAVGRLRTALEQLTRVLDAGDRTAFAALLGEGRRRTPGD